MSKFRKGIDTVQESAERSGSFSGGSRRYFKWDPGEEKVIRFLTDGDDIVLTALHEFVPCHDGSKRSFVCRRELGEDCELCERIEATRAAGQKTDLRRREIAYGIAVWREPKKKDGKVVMGTKMEEVEVDKDGKKVKEFQPWVGIVQQAPKNFWSWFWSAHANKGTLCDRDYMVRRVGQGMDTDYQPFPEDPSEMDLSKFDEFKPDIEGMLEFLGSKEYYDKWLHNIQPTKVEQAEAESEEDDAETDLAILRESNAALANDALSAFD